MRSSTVLTVRLLIYLASPLVFSTGLAQTLAPIHKLPLNEPLEKYNNPPAPPRKMETSPRMISPYGYFVSYQANVDANGDNILGDAANEPSISVDPTDGNKIVITWRQFNSISSDFRQAGWGYTADAGIHWTFPGVLQNNVFRSDPVSLADETGKFFYLSLQSDQAQSFFAMTSGARPTVANPGRRADRVMEAIRNGLPSIEPMARDTGFNTSFGPASSLVTPGNSPAPPMVGLPG